jgi:S-adenosylmethionine:tRNA ribosyltransferase-isomerase
MYLSEFSYDLPKEFIAQSPLANRASSKLMVLDLADALVHHAVFSAIADMFKPGDLLLLNDTKVLKARLYRLKAEDLRA